MSLLQFTIAVDQVFNTLTGGYADETLSARLHRTESRWRKVVNALFFWQADHCLAAFESEMLRRQLPSVYRQG